MQNIHRFKALAFFLIAADILAASGGTVREATIPAKGLNDDANDRSNHDHHEGSDEYGNDDGGGGRNSSTGDD